MRRIFPALGILLAFSSAFGQQTTSSAATLPQRDPLAATLASQAVRAVAGLTPLTDVTLNCTVTRIAGSDEESGAATLELAGYQQSRTVLNLTEGARQEVRNASEGPSGAWAGPDGVWHAEALHNEWSPADWFFPVFTLQAALADPTWGLEYAGQEDLDGSPVAHLTLYRVVAGPSSASTALVERLSTVAIYLDAASSLPVAARFDTHPDGDANTNLAVEVRFSGYRAVSGIQVPFRIQKFLQGSLLLDLSVTSAAINSNLPASDFAVPTSPTGGAQ